MKCCAVVSRATAAFPGTELASYGVGRCGAEQSVD